MTVRAAHATCSALSRRRGQGPPFSRLKGEDMPQNSWSPKRERQYEHIKEGEKERGRSEGTAERIAAATVNKTRSEHGETKEQRKKKPSSAASLRHVAHA